VIWHIISRPVSLVSHLLFMYSIVDCLLTMWIIKCCLIESVLVVEWCSNRIWSENWHAI